MACWKSREELEQLKEDFKDSVTTKNEVFDEKGNLRRFVRRYVINDAVDAGTEERMCEFIFYDWVTKVFTVHGEAQTKKELRVAILKYTKPQFVARLLEHMKN